VRRAGEVSYLLGEVSGRSGSCPTGHGWKPIPKRSGIIETLQAREFGSSLGDIDRPTGSVFQTVN